MTTSKTMCMATVAMLTLNLGAVTASAKPPTKTSEQVRLEEAEKHFEEAKMFYKNAEFVKAAAAFMLAYSKSNRPATLFNAARAYQKAGMYEQAIPLFQEYMKRKDAEESGKDEAVGHIMDMRFELEKRKATSSPPKPEPVPIPVSVTATSAPIPQPTSGRTLTWSLIGGGSALVLGGLGGFIAGNARIEEVNTSTNWAAPTAEANYRDTVAGAKNLRTLSAVGAGVGAAVLGYGLFRLLTEPEPTKDILPTKALTITPLIGKDDVTLALGWRW
jgi:tetratricopeptide (TPR) repeat protein